MTIDGTEYLTPQQFATARGISLKSAYNWINAKEDSSGFRIESMDFVGRKLINISNYKGKLNLEG